MGKKGVLSCVSVCVRLRKAVIPCPFLLIIRNTPLFSTVGEQIRHPLKEQAQPYKKGELLALIAEGEELMESVGNWGFSGNFGCMAHSVSTTVRGEVPTEVFPHSPWAGSEICVTACPGPDSKNLSQVGNALGFPWAKVGIGSRQGLPANN